MRRAHWVMLFLVGGCASSAPTPTAEPPTPPQAPASVDEPPESPASRPSAPNAASEADALATKMVAHHGSVERLRAASFTFVVEVDGQEKARRRHVARFDEGSLEVTLPEATVNIDMRDPAALSAAAGEPAAHTELWKRVAPDVEPDTAANAWGAFINDFFWLVAPSKAFDRGTDRSLDGQGRLVVTYTSGGVTPGDSYTYTVDGDGRVTGWSFRLGSGREGSFVWADHARRGPIDVSLARESEDGKARITFEDVALSD